MYVVKTQKLASYLMALGFRLLKVDIDKNNPRYNIFLFKKTEELLAAITEYSTEETN